MSFDVIVLGGGIMGASTALALVNAGKKVLLLEQFQAGHIKGSSHGDGRIVRFNYTEGIYVEMAKLGYPAWERLSRDAGETLLMTTGILEYGPLGNREVQESENQLKSHGIPYETLSHAEAAKRFPQYRLKENTEIIYQPEGAIARATPSVLATWKLFQARGGTALTGQRISKLEVSPEHVKVTSLNGDSWEAESLVVTTGSWSKDMIGALGMSLPLLPTQETLAYFAPKENAPSHRVGDMPIMIDYHDAENPFYCLPIVEVQGVKLGWHHTGKVIHPDDERETPNAILEGMRDWIAQTFPYLQPREIEIASCLYTNTPDYHFILDKHPRYENIVIGAGFSGHGFKFGPIIGEILAMLVMGQASPLSLETFRINRFESNDDLERHLGA
jgi:monomeric sarcosine oxidase